MILGIGIDIIEIERFLQWHQFSKTRLRRIFSEQEIAYCLSSAKKSAERFAVRFAAREALYKALMAMSPDHQIPLLTLCRYIAIQSHRNGMVFITIDPVWFEQSFSMTLNGIRIHLSVSHNHTNAVAQVIIEQV